MSVLFGFKLALTAGLEYADCILCKDLKFPPLPSKERVPGYDGEDTILEI